MKGARLTAAAQGLRKREGLAPLRLLPALAKVAQLHAEKMAAEGKVYHSRHRGGEVVAGGFLSSELAVRGWRRSRSHWRILRGARSAGFGEATGTNGRVYYVGCF